MFLIGHSGTVDRWSNRCIDSTSYLVWCNCFTFWCWFLGIQWLSLCTFSSIFFIFFLLLFVFSLSCMCESVFKWISIQQVLDPKKKLHQRLELQVPYSLYYTSTNMLSLMSVQFACMCKNHLKLQRQVLLMIAM